MKYNIISYNIQGAPTVEADKICFYVQIAITPEGIEIKEVKDEFGNISQEVKFKQIDFQVFKLPDTLTAKDMQLELTKAVIEYVTTNYGKLTLNSIIQ